MMSLLVSLLPQIAMGQTPFHSMMELATVTSVTEVDTVSGKTRFLVASKEATPRQVFLYAPGGQGSVDLAWTSGGEPSTAAPRNLAFAFAPDFMNRGAAWAIIGVPESYGPSISEQRRLERQHIESVLQVARKIRAIFPHAKLFMIGHSNGGITAGMQAIEPKPEFDGIIMSAPNLKWLPYRWSTRTQVPMLFITHKRDDCPSTAAFKTIQAAGDNFPLVVIDVPLLGEATECNRPPGPHFFSGAYSEYADAVLRWAASK